jgi:uncharacterized SAM-binding protein YcdF (DUF218 family)
MYRLIVSLVDPFLLCLLLLGLGLAALWRSKQTPRGRLWIATVSYLALVTVCMPPLAFWAAGTLEWAYPPRYDVPADTQAIVVLGGRVEPADQFRSRPELDEETVMRCLTAAQLYREGGPCLVFSSGGNPDPDHPGPTCGQAMSDFLADLGIPPSDLWHEGESRTTHENAVQTRRVLAPRGIENIVLVTSASHLRRAELCFRAQGFRVTPRGANYRATQLQWSVRTFLPSAKAVGTIDAVIHEWLGLAWYWLHGRI